MSWQAHRDCDLPALLERVAMERVAMERVAAEHVAIQSAEKAAAA